MTVATLPSRSSISPPPQRFKNGVEWLRSLGDVSLERVLFDPWPGSATEEDFIRLNDGDEKRPCELVDGTLVEKVVGTWESIIGGRILTAINNFIHQKNLGWATGEQGPARTSESRVRMPDVSFFLADQFPGREIPRTPIPDVSPAFAVEVLSKGNTKLEMRQKTKEYFSAGTRLLWLVNPKDCTVAIFDHDSDEPASVLAEGAMLNGGDVLPGFTLEVSGLFATSY